MKVKSVLIVIVAYLLINQLMTAIHKFGINNLNNTGVVVTIYFLSLCLSIVSIIILGKLFVKKDNCEK